MTKKALLIGLGLSLINVLFILFMVAVTTVEKEPAFWPVMIGVILFLLPVNLFVATKMPGTGKDEK